MQFFRPLIRTSRARILLIFCAGLAAYACALGGSFKTMDDETSIVQNELIKDFSRTGEIFRTSFFGGDTYYRPLVSLSFMLEYRLFGLEPFFYHLTNLILHLGSALVLLLILDVIFKKKGLSLAAALLFTVHPLQWEAISNIAGRSILLCALGYFLSFLFYLRYLGRKKLRYLVFSCAAFAASLLSKESAVTLPAALLSYELLMVPGRGKRRMSREIARRLTPFAALWAGYFLLRQILGITHVSFWPSWKFQVLGVLTFLRGCLTYLRLFVLPVDLHFDRAISYFTDWTPPALRATVVIWAAGAWIVFRFRGHFSRRVRFFLVWIGTAFVPMAQFFPLPAFSGYAALAEHFLYIPLGGAAALMVLAAGEFLRKAKKFKLVSAAVLRAAYAAFFLYLIVTSVSQSFYSSQELAMFEQSLGYTPQNARVRISYGLALAKCGLFKEAEKHFRRVLAVEPWDARARIALAKSLCDQGKCLEAISEYEAVADAGNMRGLLEKNLKYTYDVVIRQYLDRLAAEPDNSRLYYSLGVIYAKSGRTQEAIAQYKKAVALDPRYRYALFNLGAALETLGHDGEAAVYFKKIVSMDDPPDLLTGLAYQHLGHLSRRRGRVRQADFYLQKARETLTPSGD